MRCGIWRKILVSALSLLYKNRLKLLCETPLKVIFQTTRGPTRTIFAQRQRCVSFMSGDSHRCCIQGNLDNRGQRLVVSHGNRLLKKNNFLFVLDIFAQHFHFQKLLILNASAQNNVYLLQIHF